MARRAGFVSFCQSPNPSLSILVVSHNTSHLKNISEGISRDDTDGPGIVVNTCEQISQALNVKEPPETDFAVFCVDKKRFEALTEIELSIQKLDRALLLDRICLICDNSKVPGSLMPKVLHLKHKYQLHVLWGDIEGDSDLICKRLKNLVMSVCGAVSGFPIISHRSWHGMYAEEFSSVPHDTDMTF